MTITNQAMRYGYYVACFVGLELLHLLMLRPLALAPLLAPAGVLLGLLLISRMISGRQESATQIVASIAKQQREYFHREFLIYVVAALLSHIVFREVLALPLHDVLFGTVFILILGFFAALENTLSASRRWYEEGVRQQLNSFRLVPISQTLSRAVQVLLALLLLSLGVSLFRLDVGMEVAAGQPQRLVWHFALEQLFFLLLMGYLGLRVVRRYAANIHYILESQFKVVRDAQAGDYANEIPLLSQGELGLMGIQLNRLLEYIRKREDVENLLKRVVSPDIMETLLNTDTEQLKRGEEREVAILFCDIRGFTEMSEGASATEIIFFLNAFFSELAEMVARNHGTINKFMGDAVLAVYSGENARQAVDAAINTANEIIMRVRQMRLPNGGCPETGTGIHFGRVVAGTIGSEQRYEYTFLGDAVNTASRLQGLSKRFGYPIIVSAEAHGLMSEFLKDNLTDLGQHRVRGKAEALHIYGGPS